MKSICMICLLFCMNLAVHAAGPDPAATITQVVRLDISTASRIAARTAKVQHILPGEIPGIRSALISLASGVSHRQPATEAEDQVFLVLAGAGEIAAKGQIHQVAAETIAHFPVGWSVDLKAGTNGLDVLLLSLTLTPADREDLAAHAELNSVAYVRAFKQCEAYGEAIKSAKTVSRTLLPKDLVPRMAIGTVETIGPDKVAPHRHPMLEQYFLGLENNDITVVADEVEMALKAFELFHIPRGSNHGALVAAGRKLYYIWMDFFQDRKGLEWLNEHKPLAPAAPSAGQTEDDRALIEKVKKAMLAMQRRAWEQGTASQSLLELGDTENTILLAKDAVVNQIKDGRLGLNEGNSAVTDPASNGEPVLFAAKATGDSSLFKAAGRMLEFLLYKAPRTRDGIIYHNYIENRIWVDGAYMAPPFLAVIGQYQEAVKQLVGYRKYLQDPEKRLYYHIWDEDKKEFERKVFWGVGNGWAAAGIARVIRTLPDTMKKEKSMLAGYAKEIIDGALVFQRQDGLFHDIIDDPKTFIETNSAQMFAYTIYRGVRAGWLDASYITYADKMRRAVHGKVDSFGLVQGVCGAPYFYSAGTATEGQAFFLLMEAAYNDYVKK